MLDAYNLTSGNPNTGQYVKAEPRRGGGDASSFERRPDVHYGL